MKFKLIEGVNKNNQHYTINMESDNSSDIINTVETEIYISKYKDNIYYFGYKLNDNCSKNERTQFINWLKEQSIETITPDFESFIIKPLKALYAKMFQNKSIDAIISPKSERSELVNIIKYIFNSIMPRNTVKSNFELIKNLPSDISFDWEQFNNEYEGQINDSRYKQIYNHIENELMPKIHSLDYFSIAQNVRPKYRRYIQNYLKFKSKEEENLYKAIKSGNILIIDDISTTGSTLDEILKLINSLNSQCNIYIFTLIGK